MQSVFLLQHLHVLEDGEESVKVIGVYRTESAAAMAVNRLKTQPGFCDHPTIVEDGDGFYISEYPLDKDHWPEGYVSTDDA